MTAALTEGNREYFILTCPINIFLLYVLNQKRYFTTLLISNYVFLLHYIMVGFPSPLIYDISLQNCFMDSKRTVN